MSDDNTRYLYGSKAILGHLATSYGYKITRFSLWRLSRRDSDPFPLRVQLNGRRQRVVVSLRLVESWARRNIAPPDDRATM